MTSLKAVTSFEPVSQQNPHLSHPHWLRVQWTTTGDFRAKSDLEPVSQSPGKNGATRNCLSTGSLAQTPKTPRKPQQTSNTQLSHRHWLKLAQLAQAGSGV